MGRNRKETLVKMIVGYMAKGNVSHLGRFVRKGTDRDGLTYTLYAPACQGLNARSISYLGKTTLTEVTCRRCQAKVKAHFELIPLT